MMSGQLKDFLLQNFGENIMNVILPKIEQLGCSQVEDLAYLETEDIQDIQLSKIAYRKFLSILQSLKGKRNDCGRQDIAPEKSEKQKEKETSLEMIQQGLVALNFFLTNNKVGLADFLRQQKKDPSAFNEMVEGIIFFLEEKTGFPYNSLATFAFHRITRMQCLKALLDKIKQECFLKKRIEFPLKTRKVLIWTLLNNCTEELRLQLLLLLSQFCSIPLLSLSEIQDNPFELKYNITPEIYWILKPMPAMLCIDIGPKKQTKIINSFFGTDFDEDSLLDHGSVDIQFDINYKPPRRGFSVLKTDNNIQEKFLYQCVRFSSIYLLIVHYDVLADHLSTVQNFYEKIEKYAEDIDEKPFFLMVTGLEGEDFLFEEETSNLFKQQHGLDRLTKLKILVLPNQTSNNSEMITKITQSSMIKDIQRYLASKSSKVMNHIEFLDNFQITSYEEENRLVEDFLKTIKENSEDFYNKNFLPMYSYYSKYCKTTKKISDDFQVWQNHNQYNQLAGELATLKNIMDGLDPNTLVKPTNILHQFVRILSKKNSFLLIYSISNRLKIFIDERLGFEKKLYFDAKDQYHRLKSHNKSNPGLPELEMKVLDLQEKLEKRTLSLEIIWRELVQFYCYQHKTCFDLYGEQCMMQILSKYTENGLPFEIIDGDNIRLSEKFLKTAILPRHKKVLVISIIGPQSSGKSTLLNYLFGCQFATSSGRCTKGIYGTLFDCSFGEYDGLLLLDTEGLFSPEKADPEFDRKIVLFCFAVSHIVLINVRGDLNRNMQEVLTISLNVLDELKVSKVPSPTIFFVLNQNPDPNVENHLTAFNKIVESLSEEVDINKMLNISAKTLVVLPSAFSDICVYDDELSTKWIILTPSNIFGNECSSLLNKIWEEAETRVKTTDDCPFSNIQEWNNFAQDIWSTIENFKGLIYLNEMKEIRQQEKVKVMILDFVKREFEEDAPARELHQRILTIVKRIEKKDVAELELEQYWERKIAMIKPLWQACLKDLKLTPTVHERADYLFRSHINIQKSRSISRLNSQLEEMQARNDTINGETRIKHKIRSILNDHSHEIMEDEARSIFDQLFTEITNDMGKRQNLGKIKFTLKSQLYTQYQTICHKLPELGVICENNDSIIFDTTCFSSQNSSEPDIFSKDVLANSYLNLTSQLFRIEPQSPFGVRILLALYSIDWSLLFNELKKLPYNLDIHNILWDLSRELSYLGLDLTGNCYKELRDYRGNAQCQKQPPLPKNNWFTVISQEIISQNPSMWKYLDIRNFSKSFEHYQHNGEILNLKEKKFFQSLWQSLGLKKNVPIQNKHTTYYSSGDLVSRWLVNVETHNMTIENLILYCIQRIEAEKIKMRITEITTQTLNGTLRDSSQITTTSLKFILSEIQNLVEKISSELEQLGLRFTLPGEGRLHEYAFKQILKLASEKSFEEQQKNKRIWIQERKRLQDFFISQVMVKKNEETDKALVQNIVKALEDEILRGLKTKSQIEYNILLEQNKDLFTRDTLQTVADAHLIDSNRPDLVFDYIINPAKIFKEEFGKSWSNFLRNCSKDVLRTYKAAHYSIDACLEFFKDIVEQLKKAYSKKDEVEIFKIDLTDGEEFSEEVSKSVRQARSEAPFKCLGLFLDRDDFQDFKINGFFIQANLSLEWNVDIDQDEIQQEIFKSLSKESYQTFNLACFLHHFILQLEQLSKRIQDMAFEELELSLQKNEMKLLAVGCTRTCPICGRICDAVHGSHPGCLLDRHECKKGHQYQAMRGVHIMSTKEAVLETCNDQKNETRWIWKDIHTTWGEMKKSESLQEWNYDTLPTEQAVLNGKFYRAWMIAGEQICKYYKIIHHNNFDKKY